MTKMYNTREAVELMKSWGINFTPGTMHVWRCRGEGPKYMKIRSRVYYSKEALSEFVQKGREEVETKDSIIL